MQTCLITGNAGFLGSHLQDELIRLGFYVVGIDNLSGGFRRNINQKTDFELINTNIREQVDWVFNRHKPDFVFHLSADATEGRSQFTPVSCTRDNLVSSVNIFTSAIKHKAKRIIFTSSMSVYGDQEPPFSEDMQTKPVDVYGVNKASSEKILEVLAKLNETEYVIIRPHNIFGERQNIRDVYRNVVGIFMNRIMQGKAPIIYGDGEQTRAFTYIDNIIPCFIKSMTCQSGEIFNVGPTEKFSINHLARVVLQAFNSDLKPIHYPDRPLEVKHAFCTVDKSVEKLGYETKVSFDEGIVRMAKWAKELGPQEFIYLDNLELLNEHTPTTWSRKEM